MLASIEGNSGGIRTPGDDVADRPCRLTFRGVRGSVATPTPRNRRYGGETSCLELRLGPAHCLIVDCGTGIRAATEEDAGETIYDVLLSHYHSDHLAGLALFEPLYDERARITFYGHRYEGLGVREVLEQAIAPPWWPVSLSATPSANSYVDLDGPTLTLGPLTVTCSRLNHPQGITAFRFEPNWPAAPMC
jgi:phosphoribosyl 1,2-cyclic phosphodiesterase